MPPDSPDPRYCCAGCRVVAELIRGADLTRFYSLGGGQPVGRAPTPSRRDWLVEEIDRGRLAGGQVRVRVDVQGIHCAGCVWLLTELWRRRDGALHIDVNPSLGAMTLVYDAARLDLTAYLDEVERFGYRTARASKTTGGTDRSLLIRLGICAALAMNAMVFAFAEYLGMSPADGQVYTLFQGLSFGLASAAVLIGGPVFFRSALVGARRRVLHMDQPISVGIALAYAGSAIQYFRGDPTSYFDTVTVFVALMLAGRFLQQRAVRRNRNYLLANVGADDLRARRVVAEGLQLVPLTDLRAGDRLLLSAGDLVPATCRLLDDAADFSLDWINGESAPRRIAAGATVPAGAFLRSNHAVTVESLVDVAESDLLQLLATPTGDRDDRAHSRFWSRLNRGYVLGVFGLALAAALVWLAVDSSRAIEIAVSVLVVTCPCALGLATPLSFEFALAQLRRRGIYVRTTSLLEKARSIRKVIFDKTGTLTWGELAATVVEPVPAAYRDVLLTMAHASGHPVSHCIAAALDGDGFRRLDGLRVEESPGAGLRAVHAGHEFRLGSPAFAAGDDDPAAADRDGCLFTRDGRVEARFTIHETLRAGFRAEVQHLHDDGLELHILSGDRQAKVDDVARSLGIPADRALGDQSPAAKAEHIRRLDACDTLMVGDGLNDAPAFDTAWCAGAAALDRPVMPARADFFFLGGGSTAVRSILATARLLRRVVTTNLWLAASYNAIALTLCFLGMMTPLLCAVLMPLSSLVLVWHSVARLRA